MGDPRFQIVRPGSKTGPRRLLVPRDRHGDGHSVVLLRQRRGASTLDAYAASSVVEDQTGFGRYCRERSEDAVIERFELLDPCLGEVSCLSPVLCPGASESSAQEGTEDGPDRNKRNEAPDESFGVSQTFLSVSFPRFHGNFTRFSFRE